jgi:hypothetical protein
MVGLLVNHPTPFNKHNHHGGAIHCYSSMAVANQPALPPGASSEGVGQGRYSRVLFNNAYRLLKKLISKVENIILVFISSQLLSAPKQCSRTSPTVRTARTSYLFLPTPFSHAFGWLLCIKICYHQPSKANV